MELENYKKKLNKHQEIILEDNLDRLEILLNKKNKNIDMEKQLMQ